MNTAVLNSFCSVCLVLLFCLKCFLAFEQDLLLKCCSPVQPKQSWHDSFKGVVLNVSISAVQISDA